MYNFYEEFKKYQKQFLEDTQKLLQIPSVLTKYDENNQYPFGKDIHDALVFMLDIAKRDGFASKNVDNYAAHLEIGDGEEILGILCHLDVVPTGEGWTYPPFSATVIDGKIYARGSSDDKGPTMAAYYALKMLKDLNINFNKKVRIILGLDEESGWRCVDHYFKKEAMPNIGFAPDANFPLIYGEKGILTSVFKGKVASQNIYSINFGERSNVVPSKATAIVDASLANNYNDFLKKHNYKGEIKKLENNKAELIAYGKNAHAMEPEKGLNAGFILVTYLNEVANNQFVKFLVQYLTFDSRAKKLAINYTNEIMGDLTCNFGVCNYEEGNFVVTLNFRYPINFNVDLMTEKLTKVASSYNFSYEVISNSKPHFVDPNSELIKILHNAYIKYTNDDKTPLMTIGGGTYARAIKNAVAFGALMPNKEELAHQVDEYIEIEDLYKTVAIYAEAIYNLTR